jgi:hypothetical protein
MFDTDAELIAWQRRQAQLADARRRQQRERERERWERAYLPGLSPDPGRYTSLVPDWEPDSAVRAPGRRKR